MSSTRITLVAPTFHAVGRAQNALAHTALLRYPRDRVCVGSVPNQDDQSQGEYQEVPDLQDVRPHALEITNAAVAKTQTANAMAIFFIGTPAF